jgi:uncharacterized protein YqeY
MSIVIQINDAIKTAMLARDKDRLSPLRDVKAKILLEASSGGAGEVSDEAALKICMKLHKQRMETYDLYISQNRPDLAEVELYQANVIEEYLPKMLSEDEIRVEVLNAIASVNATGMQDLGKLMGLLSGKLAGKADGKIIANLVKLELGNL